MRIFLIRHGESEGNVIHQINDNPQRVVNLTARGKAQAEAAAVRLRGVHFSHAYVSEFPRAQQTARVLLRDRDLGLSIDVRLNERRSGMDGMPVAAFNDLVGADPLGTRPAYGESFLELMARMHEFLDETAAVYPTGTVLAVSHENPIVAAKALLAADPAQVVHDQFDNCEWWEMDWPPRPAAI